MPGFLKTLQAQLASSWQLSLIMTGALAYAVVCIVQEIRSELAGALAMLALGIILGAKAFEQSSRWRTEHRPYSRVTAWVLLVAGIGLMLIPGIMQKPTGENLVLTLFFWAGICWFCGLRSLGWAFMPVLIFVFIIPLREQLLLFISYPLRLSSTAISVEMLQLFGVAITSYLTTIQISGQNIAITDACSGVQQFEAMVLVAYLLVQMWRRAFAWKVVHYLFLLPAIIFSNAVRIILIVLLYDFIGETILVGNWHIGLGYFQLVLALALIYCAGLFLPEENEKTKPDK